MRAHLRYLSYVVRHKAFVLYAGFRTGAPLWRLLIHDWSKFLPCEWFPYVRKFYASPPALNPVYHGWGERVAARAAWLAHTDAEFDRAWLHHQHANPHHWQHWLLVNDNPGKTWAVGSGKAALLALLRDWTPVVDLHGCVEAMNDAGAVLAILNRAPVALPMPEHFVREMVADWAGAGRAITGSWEVSAWYAKNKEKIVLHPKTRCLVVILLEAHFPCEPSKP